MKMQAHHAGPLKPPIPTLLPLICGARDSETERWQMQMHRRLFIGASARARAGARPPDTAVRGPGVCPTSSRTIKSITHLSLYQNRNNTSNLGLKAWV